jgi:hypothetical protein
MPSFICIPHDCGCVPLANRDLRALVTSCRKGAIDSNPRSYRCNRKHASSVVEQRSRDAVESKVRYCGKLGESFLSCRGRTGSRSRSLTRVSVFAGSRRVQLNARKNRQQAQQQDSEKAHKERKRTERARPRVIVLFQQLRWQWDQRATMPSTIEQLILH